jgi:hypothetical protein
MISSISGRIFHDQVNGSAVWLRSRFAVYWKEYYLGYRLSTDLMSIFGSS